MPTTLLRWLNVGCFRFIINCCFFFTFSSCAHTRCEERKKHLSLAGLKNYPKSTYLETTIHKLLSIAVTLTNQKQLFSWCNDSKSLSKNNWFLLLQFCMFQRGLSWFFGTCCFLVHFSYSNFYSTHLLGYNEWLIGS